MGWFTRRTQTTGHSPGYITFRLEMTNATFYTTIPQNVLATARQLSNGLVPDMENDYLLDAELVADGTAAADCHAYGRTPHSRFFTPRFIDMTLHVDGNQGTQASECANANYTLSLYAFWHGEGPVDINGTAWNSPLDLCAKGLGSPSHVGDISLVQGCVGIIPFRLANLTLGNPARGTLNGTLDDTLQGVSVPPGALEDDLKFDWTLGVVATDIPSIPTTYNYDPRLVRVTVDDFKLLYGQVAVPGTGITVPGVDNGVDNDWIFDLSIGNANGGCAAELRSLPNYTFQPRDLDLLIYNGAGCENQQLTLALIPYRYLDDVLYDINGTAGHACTALPGQRSDQTPGCSLYLTIPLQDNLNLTNQYANGSLDTTCPPLLTGDACAAWMSAYALIEHDVNLTYDIHVWHNPKTATAHLAFDLTPDPLCSASNPTLCAAAPKTDDWMLAGRAVDTATGGQQCYALARTTHTRYITPTGLDITFRGASTSSIQNCLQNPLTITLFAYEHVDGTPLDLNGTANKTINCTPLPNSYTVPASVSPQLHTAIGDAQGCELVIAWSDPAHQPTGSSDGANDGDPKTIATKATINWTLDRYLT